MRTVIGVDRKAMDQGVVGPKENAWEAFKAFKKRYSKYLVGNLTPLLPYWHIEDGFVVLKDGSYEIGVLLEPGPDIYKDFAQREQAVSALVSAISAMPDESRARLHISSVEASIEPIRQYLQTKVNPDPLFRRMALEKAKLHLKEALAGRRLTWQFILTVHVPNRERVAGGNFLTIFLNRLRQSIGGAQAKGVEFTPMSPDEWEKLRRDATSLLNTLSYALQASGFKARPLKRNEIFTAIYSWFNHPPREALEYTPPREFWLPGEPVRKRLDPQTTRRQVARTPIWNLLSRGFYKYDPGRDEYQEWVGGYEMEAPPTATEWGMLADLFAANPMEIVVDLVKLPKQQVVERLSKILARSYRSNTSGDTPEASSLVREGTVLKLLMQLESGETAWEIGLQVYLKARGIENLEKALERYQANVELFPGKLRPLREGVFYPYLNSAPFSGGKIRRRFIAAGINAAHFLALASPWTREGDKAKVVSLLSNRFLGFTYVDPFDPSARAWNAVVVGSTGAGKTFTMLSLIAEAYASHQDGVEIIIVDKKGDYAPFVKMLRGSVVDIAPGSGASINMFAPEPDPKTGLLPRELDEEHQAFLQRIFHILYAGNSQDLALKEQLWLEACRMAYRAHVEEEYTEDGQVATYRVTPPTFSEVLNTLRSLDTLGRDTLDPVQKAVARGLATELGTWTKGPLASFLDRQTSLPDRGNVIYYNLAGIDAFKDDRVMALALALISKRIYDRLNRSPRGRRKIIVFDEAHALFKIKEAADLVVDLYRRARSYGAAIWTATQTIEEYRSPYVQGLLENTQIFMILNSTRQGKNLVEVLQLPDVVGQLAENLVRGQGYNEMLYLLQGSDGKVRGDIVRITPSPYEYWLFTSDAQEAARREEAARRNGGSLVRAIEELAGVDPEEDELVEALLEE